MKTLIVIGVPDSSKLTDSDYALGLLHHAARDPKQYGLGWGAGTYSIMMETHAALFGNKRLLEQVVQQAQKVVLVLPESTVEWTPSTLDNKQFMDNFNRKTLKKFVKDSGAQGLTFLGFQLKH